SFTAVVSSHAPKSMRSSKTDAEQKFEEILQRFEIPLLQYATRITGDRERARDVVQETFIKFQRNGALSRSEEPATWLFTVCRNGALNVCRKEKRMMYLDEEIIESQKDRQLMPYQRMEEQEAAGFLTRIVATLPSREAQRFVDETRELATALKNEFASEIKTETAEPANLIDIRDDRWFWSIARPLAIAAALALLAVVSGVVVFSLRHESVRVAQAD